MPRWDWEIGTFGILGLDEDMRVKPQDGAGPSEEEEEARGDPLRHVRTQQEVAAS